MKPNQYANIKGVTSHSNWNWTVKDDDGNMGSVNAQPHNDNNYDSGWANWAGTYSVEDGVDHCTSERITCAYYAIHDISPKGNGTYWKDFIGKKQYK